MVLKMRACHICCHVRRCSGLSRDGPKAQSLYRLLCIQSHHEASSTCWNDLNSRFFSFFLPQFSFAPVRQLSHCHVCVRLSVLLWSNLHLIVLHKGTIKWIWRWISVHICLMDSNKWSDRIWLKKTHITKQSDNFGPLFFCLFVAFNKHLWAAWFSYFPSVVSLWFWSPCGSLLGCAHTIRHT